MQSVETSTVKFDPGYAKFVTILSISLDFIYKEISAIKNFNQKKFKFKIYYNKIINMIDNNIGFCMGSLLWAVYIKSLGNIDIEGNPCLGDNFNENECVEEINFSKDYYYQFRKDCAYYLNKVYDINSFHLKILDLYKEFLLLNKNFVSTKNTSDIILPNSIKIPSNNELEIIHNKIQEVLKTGNLLNLTEVFSYIYEE